MKNYLILSFLSILLFACNTLKSVDTPVKQKNTYQVSSQQQAFYPLLFQDFSGLTKLSFIVRLNRDTVYPSPLPEERSDSSITQLNKLIGFSDCNEIIQGPYHASALFAWAYFNNEMRIYSFLNGNYKNGFTYGAFNNPLAVISVGKDYRYTFELIDNAYQFTVTDMSTGQIVGTRQMPRPACTGSFRGHLIGPFFGGDFSAPKNMSMEITIE